MRKRIMNVINKISELVKNISIRRILSVIMSAIALILVIVILFLPSCVIYATLKSLNRSTPYLSFVFLIIIRPIIFRLFVNEEILEEAQFIFFIILVAVFIWGYALELRNWFYKVREFFIRHRTLTRLALSVIYGFLVPLAFLSSKWMAGKIINLYIPIDPSRLPALLEAFTWLALIIALFFLIFALPAAFFFISFTFWQFFVIYTMIRALLSALRTVFSAMKDSSRSLKEICETEMAGSIELLSYSFLRAVGSIMAGALFYLIASEVYNGINYILHSPLISQAIAIIGHYEHGFCENYEPDQGERIAQVGENIISVAVPDRERGGYKFEIRSCSLDSIYR